MKVKYIITSILLAVIAFPAFSGIRRASQPIPGSYIVVLKDDVPRAAVALQARLLAAEFSGRLNGIMTHAIKGFGFTGSERAALALSSHPLVDFVEEDAYGHISAAENAYSFSNFLSYPESPLSSQSHTDCPWSSNGYYLCTYSNDEYWHLDRLDNRTRINQTKLYGYRTSGDGVRIYIVDTGVYAAHSEFDGRVEAGANMTIDPDVTNEPGPDDPSNEENGIVPDYTPADNPCGGWRSSSTHVAGHGTAVASAAAGRTTGVAKHATIIPIKIANCQGQLSKLVTCKG